MQNYFNYFTEIEEHFQRTRGAALLLSTLDWALIETWKDAGIPLEAVLRGIDAAFEKFHGRRRMFQKVNSLAYCSQAVLQAADQMKEAAVGGERAAAAPPQDPAGFDPASVAAYLDRNRMQLEKTAAGIAPATVCDAIMAASRTLLDIAEQCRAGTTNLEDAERRLTVVEEKIDAALLGATPEAELLAVREQADRELAGYRRKMIAAQIEQLHRQYVRKKLLEQWGLPRLSLFYMP
ncbi:MAG: hypothetical protein JO041_12920 [Acidobacteria bacterium]|nr:hypothetical protein [Acidobacteriota bacterium]